MTAARGDPALVIFDCDGVLVDTEPIVNRVFIEGLGALGAGIDEAALLRELSGASMEDRVQVIESRHDWRASPQFLSDFHERLEEALQGALHPVPGIARALEQLRLPRCVASNGLQEDMRLRLGLVGLLGHFGAHLFSAYDVGAFKPDPALFLHAARSMGAVPADAIVVEDSLPGVRAGVRAGMKVLGYAGRTDPRMLAAAGAEVFDDMAKLPELLRV